MISKGNKIKLTKLIVYSMEGYETHKRKPKTRTQNKRKKSFPDMFLTVFIVGIV